MFYKVAILFCVFLLIVDEARKYDTDLAKAAVNSIAVATKALVKRDVNATTIDALKKNMDEFRSCVDKSLANVVGEVNEDHLKPLFNVIGDQLNRFSRAFDELTKPKPSPDED